MGSEKKSELSSLKLSFLSFRFSEACTKKPFPEKDIDVSPVLPLPRGDSGAVLLPFEGRGSTTKEWIVTNILS